MELDIPTPYVQNIVSTSQIVTRNNEVTNIDLERIETLLPCTNYDRQRFAAITIRIGDPLCTGLLFSSGKLVITGCQNWMQCVNGALTITHIVQTLNPGTDYCMTNCSIQNMVARVTLPLNATQHLNIDRMYEELNAFCTYQENMFPGLSYRNEEVGVVLLCFFSGKIVITGGKSEESVTNAWQKLWPKVRRYIEEK